MADFFLRLAGNTIEELPKAPTELVASNISNRELILTWVNNSDGIGDSNLIQQWNEVTLRWVTLDVLPLTDVRHNVEDLEPNTTYKLRVAVLFNDQYFPSLTTEFMTTNLDEPTPYNVTVSDTTYSGCTVNWENDPISGMGEFNVVRIYQGSTLVSEQNAELIATSAVVTGLTQDTSYTAVVCVRDWIDLPAPAHVFYYCSTIPAAIQTVKVAPENLQVTDITYETIDLSWDNNAEGVVEGMNQYVWVFDIQGSQWSEQVAFDATSHQIAGLEEQKEYHIKVYINPTEVDWAAGYAASNEVTPTTPAQPLIAPSDLYYEFRNDYEMFFQWNNNDGTVESGNNTILCQECGEQVLETKEYYDTEFQTAWYDKQLSFETEYNIVVRLSTGDGRDPVDSDPVVVNQSYPREAVNDFHWSQDDGDTAVFTWNPQSNNWSSGEMVMYIDGVENEQAGTKNLDDNEWQLYKPDFQNEGQDRDVQIVYRYSNPYEGTQGYYNGSNTISYNFGGSVTTPVTNVQASDIGYNTMTLTWDMPELSGRTVQNMRVRVNGSDVGRFDWDATTGATSATISYEGFPEINTEYSIVIRLNLDGQNMDSDAILASTLDVPDSTTPYASFCWNSDNPLAPSMSARNNCGMEWMSCGVGDLQLYVDGVLNNTEAFPEFNGNDLYLPIVGLTTTGTTGQTVTIQHRCDMGGAGVFSGDTWNYILIHYHDQNFNAYDNAGPVKAEFYKPDIAPESGNFWIVINGDFAGKRVLEWYDTQWEEDLGSGTHSIACYYVDENANEWEATNSPIEVIN